MTFPASIIFGCGIKISLIMEKMRGIVVLLIGVMVCIHLSCKKSGQDPAPTETVLGKVFRNGQLQSEYVYNSAKQLEKINQYQVSTGQLQSTVSFHYDNAGRVEQQTNYNAAGKPSSKLTYAADNAGKPLSGEFRALIGPDSGKVTIRYKYEHNKAGLISKEAWHNPITDKEESYRLYFYYPNGNLERYEYYWTLTPTPEIAWEVHYSAARNPVPPSLFERKGYVINFSLYELVAEEIETITFDTPLSNASKYFQQISDRKYNSQGFVTAQTMTTFSMESKTPIEVVEMTYQYSEI